MQIFIKFLDFKEGTLSEYWVLDEIWSKFGLLRGKFVYRMNLVSPNSIQRSKLVLTLGLMQIFIKFLDFKEENVSKL